MLLNQLYSRDQEMIQILSKEINVAINRGEINAYATPALLRLLAERIELAQYFVIIDDEDFLEDEPPPLSQDIHDT